MVGPITAFVLHASIAAVSMYMPCTCSGVESKLSVNKDKVTGTPSCYACTADTADAVGVYVIDVTSVTRHVKILYGRSS